MNQHDEVIARTGNCLRRLAALESSVTQSVTEFHFPECTEFMPLMDAITRAQQQFTRELRNAADNEREW